MPSPGARLYFVRHGESEANLSRTFSNRDLPHRLTPRGRDEAEALGKRLAGEGITSIWSSPVPRAVETASILGRCLGLDFSLAEELREFNVGRYEGTAGVLGWQEYDAVLAAWLAGDWDRRVGGGESLQEIVMRLKSFLGRFAAACGSEDRVLFVSHGGLYRVALPLVFENVGREFAFQRIVGHAETVIGEVADGRIWCRSWCGSEPGYEAK
jgi:broad specificity phosphatase PhoE